MSMPPQLTSWQSLTAHPMRVVWRYISALLGGTLALGAHLYLTWLNTDWLAPGRIGSSLAAGLFFGIILGFMVLVASEYPQRLIGVWTQPARAALAFGGGILLGGFAWFTFHYLILFISEPDLGLILFGGAGLSIGVALHGLFGHGANRTQRIGWLLLTAALIYLPIFVTYQTFLAATNTEQPASALLYYTPSRDWMVFVLGIPFALVIAIGAYLPLFWNRKA